MNSRKDIAAVGLVVALALLSASQMVGAEEGKNADFSRMAPIEQYRMPSDDEIAMARSAAPASISGDAEILVLGNHAYETAMKGKNGFKCLVLRSWAASFGDAEFWNARIRAPICYNAAAVTTVLPVDLEKTQWVLAGLTEAQMRVRSKASDAAHQAPAMGSMSFMMSKQQHLSETDGHWHPHVMLYQPHAEAAAWGANLQGSPVLGFDGPSEAASTFVVAVMKWSDGTSASDMH